MEYVTLTPSRYYAFKKSLELGRELARDFPAISLLYREGKTLEEIASHLNIPNNFDVNGGIAVSALCRAVKILIPDDDERYALRIEHKKAGGRRTYEIYGMQISREDAQRGAKTLYERLSQEERRQKSIRAISAQGRIVWSEEEIYSFFEMLNDPAYLIKHGCNSGSPNMGLISNELNQRFHDGRHVRTNRALISYKSQHPPQP